MVKSGDKVVALEKCDAQLMTRDLKCTGVHHSLKVGRIYDVTKVYETSALGCKKTWIVLKRSSRKKSRFARVRSSAPLKNLTDMKEAVYSAMNYEGDDVLFHEEIYSFIR